MLRLFRYDDPINTRSLFYRVGKDFLCVFMGKGEDDDAAVSEFFKTYGGGIALPYQILDPLTFIQLTNGSMPLVCLFDNGSLLKEYDLLKLDEQEITSFQERN